MQITQMINAKGNPVKNQFVINVSHGQYFQSYDTIIAYKPANGNTPVLSDAWSCSTTTLKHLKLFLGVDCSKKELEQRIKSGSLILDNDLTVEA